MPRQVAETVAESRIAFRDVFGSCNNGMHCLQVTGQPGLHAIVVTMVLVMLRQ